MQGLRRRKRERLPRRTTANTARADLVKLAAAGLLAATRRGRRQEFIATRDLEAALKEYGRG